MTQRELTATLADVSARVLAIEVKLNSSSAEIPDVMVMKETMRHIEKELKDVNKGLLDRPTKAEIKPIQMIAYGGAGAILMGLATKLMESMIK